MSVFLSWGRVEVCSKSAFQDLLAPLIFFCMLHLSTFILAEDLLSEAAKCIMMSEKDLQDERVYFRLYGRSACAW